MSTFYVINDVQSLRSVGITPGILIDDSSNYNGVSATQMRTAGVLLWPSTDTKVAAAATIVAQKKGAAGLDEAGAAALMVAAVEQSMLSNQADAAVGQMAHFQVDVPLATLQGKTSGTEFNIGSALPANAKVHSSQINVVQVLGGGSVSAAKAFVQQATKTAGELQGNSGGTDVHGAGTGPQSVAGSNPYPDRGGQQLALKVTLTGDTMADLTTGHLVVDVFYTVTP